MSTQEKLGNINYFPIKAQQCFETSTMKLTNGIYLGDLRCSNSTAPLTG